MKHTVWMLALLCAAGRPGTADAAGNRKWDVRTGRVQVAMSGGRLGAQISSMTEELRRYFGAPGDQGVLVGQVDPNSPAAKAGLAVGDVIIDVDGQKVDDPSDLVGALTGKSAGTKVALTVVREKKRQTLTALLANSPRAQSFGNLDMDFDFDDLPALPGGMRVFGFDHDGHDQLEKLQKQLEVLERRLEKLEKKAR